MESGLVAAAKDESEAAVWRMAAVCVCVCVWGVGGWGVSGGGKVLTCVCV